MSENQLKNGDKKEDRDETGRFIKGKEGGPGRPEGSKNRYTIDKLMEAIETEEAIAKKENIPGLFQMFARMAYRNPNVMISLMNKFVANREKVELSTPEPININVNKVK